MSDHIHSIGYAKSGYQLSDILRDFKTFTSKQIINSILEDPGESRQEWILRLFKYFAKYNSSNTTYQFWKNDNKSIELESPKWISQRVIYIHNNPINAGKVKLAEHYIYSSANDYAEGEGLIEVELIDLVFTEGFVPT